MSVRAQRIALAWILAAGCGAAVIRAELVSPGRPDSVFYVEGLVADDLADEGISQDSDFFRTDMTSKPLVPPRRPAMAVPPRPAPASALQASMRSRGTGQGSERLRAAERYARSQQWTLALQEIQRAIEEDPENVQIMSRGAAYAALARKFGVADEYFRRVLAVETNNVPFLVGRAGVLVRLLRFDEADELVRRALQYDSHDLAARFNHTLIQVARGDEQVDRMDWDAIRTGALVELVDWLDADRSDYQAVLSPAGFTNLCDIVLGRGSAAHLDEITDTFREARLALSGRAWGDAERLLGKLAGLGLQAVGLQMDIARCRFETGDRAGGLALLKGTTERYPDTFFVLYDYGYALMIAGRFAEAIPVFEKALAREPTIGETKLALACAYAGTDQSARAWPLINELAKTRPQDLERWMTADEPFLETIRANPQYEAILQSARGL